MTDAVLHPLTRRRAAAVAVRSERDRFLLTIAVGIGAVSTVLRCPPHDDWSWPSNHATIAAALVLQRWVSVWCGQDGTRRSPIA